MFSSYSWVLFVALVLVLILIDIRAYSQCSNTPNFKIIRKTSIIWVFTSVLVFLAIFFYTGIDVALDYALAYCMELAFSIDNALMFVVIFKYFNIADKHQHKILFIGVISAIVLRLLMITLGLYVIKLYEWVLVLFGLLLIYSGYQLPIVIGGHNSAFHKNAVTKIVKYCFNFTDKQYGNNFILRKNSKIFITPLMLALIAIEKVDIIFALDSVPAILSITTDPFIIFTSNVLAILSLRSIYFIIANAIKQFTYFRYVIGYTLIYIGSKMVLTYFHTNVSGLILIFITISLIVMIIITIIKNLLLNK